MDYYLDIDRALPEFGDKAQDLQTYLEGMGKFDTPMSSEEADTTIAFFKRNFPSLAKHLTKVQG